MSEEEKLQAIVAQMKMIEAYLNDIIAREDTVARLIEESRSAIDAIRSVTGTEQVQALMPVGIGIFMQAAVAPADKLVVSVGSGVAVVKSKEEAIAYVEERMKDLETALRGMSAQKHDLAMKLEQGRAAANALIQHLQGKTG